MNKPETEIFLSSSSEAAINSVQGDLGSADDVGATGDFEKDAEKSETS
jgi:hypothetical protein